MTQCVVWRLVSGALLLVTATSLAAQQPSPYAGLERNEIKSLSTQEVSSLLAGHGMGYAKAAELNGYPGPLHVFELADRLDLTPKQLLRTRQLMDEHRSRARSLGAEVVAAERTLDRLFKDRSADATAVSMAAERVGVLQARLRAEHLNTHLAQAALLNPEQVRRYSELRGYSAASDAAGETLNHDSSSHRHGKPH